MRRHLTTTVLRRTLTVVAAAAVLAGLAGATAVAEPAAAAAPSARGKATPDVSVVAPVPAGEAVPLSEKVPLRFVVWRAKGRYEQRARIRLYRTDGPFNFCKTEDLRSTTRVPVAGVGTYSPRVRLPSQGTWAFDVVVPADGSNTRAKAVCEQFDVRGRTPTYDLRSTPRKPDLGDRVSLRVDLSGLERDYRDRATVTLISLSRKGCGAYGITEARTTHRVTGPDETWRTPKVRISSPGQYLWRLTLPGTGSQDPVSSGCGGPGFTVGKDGRTVAGTDRSHTSGTAGLRAKAQPLVVAHPGEDVRAGKPSAFQFAVFDLRTPYDELATAKIFAGGRVERSWQVRVDGRGVYRTPKARYYGGRSMHLAVALPGNRRNEPTRTVRDYALDFYVDDYRPKVEWTLPDAPPRAGERYRARLTVSNLPRSYSRTATFSMYAPVKGPRSGYRECVPKTLVRTVTRRVTGPSTTLTFPRTRVPDDAPYVGFAVEARRTRTVRPLYSVCTVGSTVQVEAPPG